MKKQLLLIIAGICLGSGLLISQELTDLTEEDYRSYPHYQEMMSNSDINFFEIQKAFYSYTKDRDPDLIGGYNVYKRWENYWRYRINRDGTFPLPRKVWDEFMLFQNNNPSSNRLKGGQESWVELGPRDLKTNLIYQDVGRVNAIAFHPSDSLKLYIGAPSGGFWRSQDGGENWETTTDHLPTLGVSAIYVRPDNPQEILIGTGDRDGGGPAPKLGVMRSIDGGDSWEFYNSGMGNVRIGMFAVHENNPDYILAAGYRGVYKTTDGGLNWNNTSLNSDNYHPASNYKDIKFKPGDMSVVYCTSIRYNSETDFYRSEDGGDTWERIAGENGISSNQRLVIGVTPANPSLVYVVAGGTFDGCFLSQDEGKTFSLQSNSPNIFGGSNVGSDDRSQSWYDICIHIDPFDESIVHVGGVNTWRSDDKGQTWSITSHWTGSGANYVHADHHTFEYHPLTNALFVGNDGGISYTTNQGASWTNISEGLGIGQLYTVGVSPNNSSIILAGLQDNGTAMKREDGWRKVTGGDGMECVVDPTNDELIYTSSQNGAYIDRILFDGLRWLEKRLLVQPSGGINETGAWESPFLISQSNPNVMILGLKNIWIATNVRNMNKNTAIPFQRISDNQFESIYSRVNELAQSPVDFNSLYFSQGKWQNPSQGYSFFRTDNLMDLEPEWIDLTTNLPDDWIVSDIECHPLDDSIIYVVIGGIYKSEDRGYSWTDISGNLPELFINNIIYDNSSDGGLYVATDAGVYYKDNSMGGWELYGDNLPVSVSVTELDIFYDSITRDQSLLRASTFGRGLWEIKLAPSDYLPPPSSLSIDSESKNIVLEWQPPFYLNGLTGYKVFRNGSELSAISETHFVDTTAQLGLVYTYYITAVYGDMNESDPSNEESGSLVDPIELDYMQDFEQSPLNWKAKNTFEGWRYDLSGGLGIVYNNSQFFGINSNKAGDGIHVADYLYSPVFDLSKYTNSLVSLKFRYCFRTLNNIDKLSIVYRVSLDSEWKKLKQMPFTSQHSWIWKDYTLILPEEALVDGVQIGFHYDDFGSFAWGAGIDDVSIFANSSSILNYENNFKVVAFPNPNNGRIILEINGASPGPIKIDIYSLGGQLVYNEQFEMNGKVITRIVDISDNAAGIYQIVVRSGELVWNDKIAIK
ncbi:MAG: T9SS type A sorting domain-containing protein [Bacteroidetes bacterium]|nr:T9SS type A sorting domain-containing protein [Bacteroidota bacterium]MBT4409151.1 T9SS type A sorting domain-containing protein [Bacteroidota bacterium]